VASVGCGIASSIIVLILCRAAQAVGAGVLNAVAPAVVADVYPPGERGKAMGTVMTGRLLGPVIGPAIGGAISYSVGWRYVFATLAGIASLNWLSVFFLFPEVITATDRPAASAAATLRLLADGTVAQLGVASGLVFGGLYIICTVMPTEFAERYTLNERQTGLVFVPFGIGTIAGGRRLVM
jgi:predicted MFS family arabinose efflux permease